jgi:hypothetical protein
MSQLDPEAEMSIKPRSFWFIAPGDRDDFVMTPEAYAAIQAVIPQPAVKRFMREGDEVVLASEHDAAIAQAHRRAKKAEAKLAALEAELAAAKGEMACRYSPFDPGEERDYDKCEHCGDYHIVKRRAEPRREAQRPDPTP